MQGKEVQSSVTIHTPHTSACAAATGHRAPVTSLKFPESYQSCEQRNCSHNPSLTQLSTTSRRFYTLLASFPSSLLSLGMRLCGQVYRISLVLRLPHSGTRTLTVMISHVVEDLLSGSGIHVDSILQSVGRIPILLLDCVELCCGNEVPCSLVRVHLVHQPVQQTQRHNN